LLPIAEPEVLISYGVLCHKQVELCPAAPSCVIKASTTILVARVTFRYKVFFKSIAAIWVLGELPGFIKTMPLSQKGYGAWPALAIRRRLDIQ
jgi:hypothetical protein